MKASQVPKIDRRRFLTSGVGVGLVAAAPLVSEVSGPTRIISSGLRPVVVSAPNGNYYRNGGSLTCVQTVFEKMARGMDVLDAIVDGVNLVELDPEEDSVGYGGLPNADGVVQLDASCMHGPKKRAGAVAALEGIRTPSRVAREVMEQTDHHLLVGSGARDFARRLGFAIEEDLNTERSRRIWLEWKRRIDPAHFLDPKRRAAELELVRGELVAEGWLRSRHLYGTIHCSAINGRGEIAGVTMTSGLAFKIPGRVGDSPILERGSTLTERSEPPARPGAAKLICTGCRRS